MSSRHHSDKFKLDMDYNDIPDDDDDQDYREERREVKLEKLSHRVTLITILIPILIVVIIIVSYLDIKQKVVQTQTSGSLGVQNLSKDLQSRFSSLSVRQANLEDAMKKQTAAIAKYDTQKKKIEDKLNNLPNRMVDKKELSSTTHKLNATLTTMKKELTSVRNSTKNTEATATKNQKQMTAIKDETQKKFQSLSQTTSKMAENKLDRNQLDLALKIRDLKLQERFQVQTKALEEEITSLKEKTDQLSKELDSALDQIKNTSKTKTVSKPKQSASPSKPASATPPAKPQKGKILEQDLN